MTVKDEKGDDKNKLYVVLKILIVQRIQSLIFYLAFLGYGKLDPACFLWALLLVI
jgi:hypothetical protein